MYKCTFRLSIHVTRRYTITNIFRAGSLIWSTLDLIVGSGNTQMHSSSVDLRHAIREAPEAIAI